jgi:uncharacterized protein YbjQ (UPF0145 family)
MEQRAADLGANAVVGVDIDYEVLGAGNGMLMVTASCRIASGVNRKGEREI